MAKVIRVRDLREQFGTPYPRPFLSCGVCGGEYSADASDYFIAAPHTILTCCDEPMVRVAKHTTLRSA